MSRRPEWDEVKSRSNRLRHGISLEAASELFTSGNDYLEIFDIEHSDEEERFVAIGPVARRLILVVWTERDGDVIRLISARWATRRERSLYYEYMDQPA